MAKPGAFVLYAARPVHGNLVESNLVESNLVERNSSKSNSSNANSSNVDLVECRSRRKTISSNVDLIENLVWSKKSNI